MENRASMRVAVSRSFLLAAFLGMLVRFLLIWTPWIEGDLIADDAYYYFTIASNMASGHGSTFDGIALTNGYHPLWMWLLVPGFWLFGDSLWLPVRMALSFSSLLDLVSGLMLYRMLATRGMHREAVVASFFWFLAPFTVFIGVRGMEASLSTALVLAVLWTLARLGERHRSPLVKEAVLVGCLLGLAGLARTDNLPTVGLVVVVFTAWRYRFRLGPGVKWLGVATVCAVGVTAPWFIWNLHHFDSVIQVSGEVKLFTREMYGSLRTDWSLPKGALATVSYALFSPFLLTARYVTGEGGGPAMLSLVVASFLMSGLVGALVLALRRRGQIPRPEFFRPFLMLATTYLVAHSLLFGVLWRSYVNWYGLPFLSILCVCFGFTLVWLGDAGQQGKRWRNAYAVVCVTVLGFLYPLFLVRTDLGPSRFEPGNRARFQALVERYPEGVRAGAYNAGMLAYTASPYDGITVLNLDGLVNNEAFRAVKEGRYLRYLIEHVDVFLEEPEMGTFFLTDEEADSLGKLYEKWSEHEIWSRYSSNE
jgi:hypothetical protein